MSIRLVTVIFSLFFHGIAISQNSSVYAIYGFEHIVDNYKNIRFYSIRSGKQDDCIRHIEQQEENFLKISKTASSPIKLLPSKCTNVLSPYFEKIVRGDRIADGYVVQASTNKFDFYSIWINIPPYLEERLCETVAASIRKNLEKPGVNIDVHCRAPL